MTTSPGYYGGHGGGYDRDPSSGYGGYGQGPAGPAGPGGQGNAYYQYSLDDVAVRDGREENAQRAKVLSIVVAVLGLATFAISFGSPAQIGWPVWLSVLAGVVGAVSVVPTQVPRGWVVVAAAVTAFLYALSEWIFAENAAWALVVIVVLTALQSIAAVAGLLLEPRSDTAAQQREQPDYRAYAEYAQAYQAYQMQYGQGAPATGAGQGTAQAYGAGTAHDQGAAAARRSVSDGSRESYEALQERYVQHGGYASAPQQHRAAGMSAGVAGSDPGLPGYDRERAARDAGEREAADGDHGQTSSG